MYDERSFKYNFIYWNEILSRGIEHKIISMKIGNTVVNTFIAKNKGILKYVSCL